MNETVKKKNKKQGKRGKKNLKKRNQDSGDLSYTFPFRLLLGVVLKGIWGGRPSLKKVVYSPIKSKIILSFYSSLY